MLQCIVSALRVPQQGMATQLCLAVTNIDGMAEVVASSFTLWLIFDWRVLVKRSATALGLNSDAFHQYFIQQIVQRIRAVADRRLRHGHFAGQVIQPATHLFQFIGDV